MDDEYAVAKRAWLAHQCLRDEHGKTPSIRSLEKQVGLHNAQLANLMGGSPQPGYDLIVKSAKALRVDPDWLFYGTGKAPSTHWPVAKWPGPKRRGGKSALAADDKAAFERESKQLAKRRAT